MSINPTAQYVCAHPAYPVTHSGGNDVGFRMYFFAKVRSLVVRLCLSGCVEGKLSSAVGILTVYSSMREFLLSCLLRFSTTKSKAACS